MSLPAPAMTRVLVTPELVRLIVSAPAPPSKVEPLTPPEAPDQGITSTAEVDITSGHCTCEGCSVSTSATKNGGVETSSVECVVTATTKDGRGIDTIQREGVVGSSGSNCGANQRCCECERVLTRTTNNRSVGDTSTEIEGVVGGTTNQCGSGNCTSTSKESNTSTKVGVVAGVDTINQQRSAPAAP